MIRRLVRRSSERGAIKNALGTHPERRCSRLVRMLDRPEFRFRSQLALLSRFMQSLHDEPRRSAFVGVPGFRAFSFPASGFTPIEPLLFHLSEVAVPHGVLIAVGTGDGFWLA